MRFKNNRNKSAKKFRKAHAKTRRINVVQVMRGGIRL